MSMKTLRLTSVGLALYLLAGNVPVLAQSDRADHWVGTWATAVVARPQAAPGAGRGPAPLNFNNQTLRQIVHTSLGGDRIRVVLSNAFGTSSTSIAAGTIAVSDPVKIAVPAFADLAIDIFLSGDTAASPSPLTTHNGQQFKGADNLHLTDAGYQAMAGAVNLALLRR